MLSKTLSEGLQSYRIGQKVRALRTAKDLGLAQLGEHTGLSAGMLSRIENGQVFPTLPTLLRIAMVFGVGLDRFFTDSEEAPVFAVVRREERMRLPGGGAGSPTYYFESLDFPVPDRVMESYFAEFAARRGAPEPHRHKGVEMIYVISGCLILTIRDEAHRLQSGDSVYFDARHSHRYHREGSAQCTAVVVVSEAEPPPKS